MYFVTQKDTWNKLQTNPATANRCGRPGINGGKNMNPNVKLGVACYGVKPKPKDIDLDMMKANNMFEVPQTPEEIELDKKVQFWKENADKMLNIVSFNKDKWSRW